MTRRYSTIRDGCEEKAAALGRGQLVKGKLRRQHVFLDVNLMICVRVIECLIRFIYVYIQTRTHRYIYVHIYTLFSLKQAPSSYS